MKHAFDTFSREHRWTFGHGIEDVVFIVPKPEHGDRNWLSDCDTAALIHGYKQKIGDAAAIPRNTETGKSATDQEKRDAMQDVVDRLNRGEWNAPKSGGKPRTINVDALVEAIATGTKRNVVGVRAWLEGKTEEQRAVFANSEQFAAGYTLALANLRPVVALSDDAMAEIDAIVGSRGGPGLD